MNHILNKHNRIGKKLKRWELGNNRHQKNGPNIRTLTGIEQTKKSNIENNRIRKTEKTKTLESLIRHKKKRTRHWEIHKGSNKQQKSDIEKTIGFATQIWKSLVIVTQSSQENKTNIGKSTGIKQKKRVEH